MPSFAEDFVSDVEAADAAWLWHVFYDGRMRAPSAVENVSGDKGREGTTGLAQSRNPVAPVGWHEA
eukprot:3361385-Lingulodinium_polyedra.AAC.1